ncbi:MAG: succinyl-diaminopimelate desuccinylase [Candidatus Dadabacteria bacterium]|nr:MAG: succinyl-diaminopimelate desuccinylase [Candidatus Dadabacteria bacterium]
MTLEELALDLVRTPSVTGSEEEIADKIERLIRSLKSVKDCLRLSNTIVARVSSPGAPYTIALCGHLDTVPGDEVGERAFVEGGRLVGTGSSDMKGGVAIMLKLLEFPPERFRFNTLFIFYESEEGPYAQNGLHQLFDGGAIKSEDIDLAFFLEPTDCVLHVGCMGIVNASVRFHGVRAHSARPWHGENAIHKAGEALVRLSRLKIPPVNVGGLEFQESMSATMAQGGIAPNIVPDLFEININYRFAPSKSIDEAKRYVEDFFKGEGEVVFGNLQPSGSIVNSNPVLKIFRETVSLPELPKHAYTDVGLFAEHGIEGVNLGPGHTSQAHKKNEYLELEDLRRCYRIYEDFLLN